MHSRQRWNFYIFRYKLLPECSERAPAKVFREHDLQSGQITTPYTCLFIDTGKYRILVDTGMGAGVVPSVGNLLMNLQEEGIEGTDIGTVILTHGHPDHIGGIIKEVP